MVASWRLLVSCTMWQHPKAAATKALCASHHPGAPGEVKPRQGPEAPEGRFLLGLVFYRKNKHLKPENVWTSWIFFAHRIHGAGIYANVGGILMVNVTIYGSTMDPMGWTNFRLQDDFLYASALLDHGHPGEWRIPKHSLSSSWIPQKPKPNGEGLDQTPWMSMDYGVSSSMNMPVLSNFGVYNFLGHSHM